jgi:hypothetical protein
MSLTRKLAMAMTMAMGTLMVSASAPAHHSAAMFDINKCQTINGSIRNFQWMNPHSWVWITTPNGKGASDVWGFEIPAPSQLVALDAHWAHNLLQKGDKVKISYSPLKDGRNGGLANAITLPNGKMMHGAPNAVQCESLNWRGTTGAKK